jgi:hypothetical protein
LKHTFILIVAWLFACAVHSEPIGDFERGVALFRAGDYAGAIDNFESARLQGMNTVSLHYNLASSYFKQGDYDSSARHFHEVAQNDEMRNLAHYNLGLIALERNDHGEAQRLFNSVLQSDADAKLKSLAKNQLAQAWQADDLLRLYLSAGIGFDDNITAAPADTTLGREDSFADLFVSLDWMLLGQRGNGWALEATWFGLDYSDNDDIDLQQYQVGAKKEFRLKAWANSLHLNAGRGEIGGEDYQSSASIEIQGQRKLGANRRLNLRYKYDDIRSEQDTYNYLEGWRQRARIELRQFNKGYTTQFYYQFEANDRDYLVTPGYSYDYSPTRHSLLAKYNRLLAGNWTLSSELALRFSDYPASIDFDRDDEQWKLSLSAAYRFDRSLNLTTRLQHISNESSVDRYDYEKSSIKLSISKLF